MFTTKTKTRKEASIRQKLEQARNVKQSKGSQCLSRECKEQIKMLKRKVTRLEARIKRMHISIDRYKQHNEASRKRESIYE